MEEAAREAHTEAEVAAWREVAMRETLTEAMQDPARQRLGSKVQAKPVKAARSLVVTAVWEVREHTDAALYSQACTWQPRHHTSKGRTPLCPCC